MLLVHIILAIASLGFATQAHTQKAIVASVLSFAGAFTSGILLQTNGVSLHGASMLALFSVIYGVLLRAALRKRSRQIS